jgi:hypothetical protein
MEHLWDLLFQLKKHGTNTLHVVFTFFFQWICGKHLITVPWYIQGVGLRISSEVSCLYPLCLKA